MAAYMLVAHQTALSDELRNAAQSLVAEDPDAEFVVLVPATPVAHRLTWDERETMAMARERAVAARDSLEAQGLRVIEARTGDSDPIQAIDDAMRDGSRTYAGIVVSTLPPGLSRWLKMDVMSRAQRHFQTLRLIHVVSAAPTPAAAAA